MWQPNFQLDLPDASTESRQNGSRNIVYFTSYPTHKVNVYMLAAILDYKVKTKNMKGCFQNGFFQGAFASRWGFINGSRQSLCIEATNWVKLEPLWVISDVWALTASLSFKWQTDNRGQENAPSVGERAKERETHLSAWTKGGGGIEINIHLSHLSLKAFFARTPLLKEWNESGSGWLQVYFHLHPAHKEEQNQNKSKENNKKNAAASGAPGLTPGRFITEINCLVDKNTVIGGVRKTRRAWWEEFTPHVGAMSPIDEYWVAPATAAF